jgi:fimbrial isopeptide formation D2 family protein/uncharacterized repeat protein (TIGR01451 family)
MKRNIYIAGLLILFLLSTPLYASIQLGFSPLNPGTFSAQSGKFIEIRLSIQNTDSEYVNNVNLTVQWENSFCRPQLLQSSQLDAQLINNSFQITISSLPAYVTKTLDFKLMLALCANPQINASATYNLDQTVMISQTIECEELAAGITVETIVSDAVKNDPTGQAFQIAIANSGGTARNISVSLDMPDNFFLVENTLSNDWQHPMNIQTNDPAFITFDNLFLGTDETIQLTFNLGTNCDAGTGNHPVITTISFDDVSNVSHSIEDFSLIDLAGGLIALDLSPIDPLPFAIEPGDRVTVKAMLTNNGNGGMNLVNMRASWGTGFDMPELGDRNITPNLGDHQYSYIADIIASKEHRYFEFSLRVISCDDLTIDLESFDPCDPDTIFTDDSSPFLILKQPNMQMSGSQATIAYCGSGTIQIQLENKDQPAGTRGFATNFTLSANMPQSLIVSNVSSGWSYANNVFSYPDGIIEAGQTHNLSFDVTPKAPCNSVSGSIIFTPVHKNACGDTFTPPLFMASYKMGEQPTISLETTMSAGGNDTQRLFLNEPVTFIVRPHITQPESWKNVLVINDLLSSAFIVQNITASHGNILQDNNQFTWTLSPHTVVNNPILTIETITTSNPCEAGKSIGNHVSIEKLETTCGCEHSASDDASGYLQNKGDTEIAALTEIREIINIPEEGSYDDCSDMTIDYNVRYLFDSNNTGVWTDSYFKDLLDGMQTYVQNTAQYRINENSPWTSIDNAYIQINNGMMIDLSFMADVYNGYTSVSKRLLDLRYTLKPSSDFIAPCTQSKSILSRSDLYIRNSPFGCDLGDNLGKHFYQMVMVPISRAVMSVDVNLNTSSVSIGERIHPTVAIKKLTPWPTHDIQVSIDTQNYYIHSPITFTGFGGKTPEIAFENNALILTFQESLIAGESGEIHFDASKRCNDDYSLTASLYYKDSCEKQCTTQNTAQPAFKLKGDLIINLTPDQVLVNNAQNLQWTIYVTNKGTGSLYNIRLNNYLKDIFEYIQTRVNDEIVEVTITPYDAHTNKVLIKSDTLAPNGVWQVDFVVNTTGVGCDLLDTNAIDITSGWIDDDLTYYQCERENAENAPVFSMPPSLIWMADSVVSPPGMCGSTTLHLELANTGMTHNYNMTLVQHLHETGFTYIPNTATVDGVSINNPTVSGTDLIWSFDASQSNYVEALIDLGIGQRHTFSIEVNVPEASFKNRIVSASISWQKPCEKGGTITSGSSSGAGYAVPVQFPEIDLKVLGWNHTAGQTETNASATIYGGVQDTVIWKVNIANSGGAPAQAIILENVLSADVLFNAVSSDPNFSNSQPINNQLNVTLYPDNIPIDSTQTLYFRSIVQEECQDIIHTATTEWGCPNDPNPGNKGGITSPNDNTDTANLISLPSIDPINIQQSIVTPGTNEYPSLNGKVTIIINNDGGTARNIVVTDQLPDGFILDTSTTPSVNSDLGNLGHIVVSGTSIQPIFSLLTNASTINSSDPHNNILRHNEKATVVFYIVRQASLDTRFDPDVRQETSNNGLDPASFNAVSNQVTLVFENSCGTQQPSASHTLSFVPPDLDLDINVGNPLSRMVNGVGDTEIFKFTVVNRGDSVATNAYISVLIADGWTGSAPNGCTGNIPGTVICDLGALKSGKSLSKTFTLEIAQETDVSIYATVIGDIYNSANTATGLTWAKDSIRSRVIGFRIERNLLQTTEAGSNNNYLLIGEDAVLEISAIFFGLEDGNVITNLTIEDTFDNGLIFVSDQINNTPGNVSLSTHTSPNMGESGSIIWKIDEINTSGAFVAENRIRLSNNAINNEAAPNIHNETHTDQCDVSFKYMGSTFNKNTSGFPGTNNCQTKFTVQTPATSFIKKIRNITQNSDLKKSVNAHAGDILEYQVLISNASERAPAYDLILTQEIPDTLILIPFDSDNLDNDGDSLTDESSEGFDNGGGRDITLQIDGTHSTAMTEILSNGQIILTYRVQVANGVNPSESFQTTAQLVYDTLPGISGAQLSEQGAHGTKNGSRIYGHSDTTTVTIDPIDTTASKSIVGLSSTEAGGAFPFKGPQNVTIGEQITFELKFSIVPSTMTDWQLIDQMPSGMICINAQPITLSNALFLPGGIILPEISPDGSQVSWNFSEQVIPPSSGIQTITAQLTAQIENIDGNQAGKSLINQNASVSYLLKNSQQNIDLDDITVIICEPDLRIQKKGRNVTRGDADDFSQFTPPDAGDILEYRIQITNGTTNAYTAFDMEMIDTLNAGQTYVLNSLSGDLSQSPDIVGTGNIDSPQTLTWGRNQASPTQIDIESSQQFVFSYQVQILDDVMPYQKLTNSIDINWSSLHGSHSSQRTGSGGVNDYAADSQTEIIVPDNCKIIKTRLDDSFGSDDDLVRIGDIVTWKLAIHFQEGRMNNVTVNDTLPDGLLFMDTLSIDNDTEAPYESSGNFSYANIQTLPVEGATSLEWQFGNLLNTSDNLTPDTIEIIYRTRITDNTIIPDTPARQTLTNIARLDYLKYDQSPAESKTSVITIDIVQPELKISKSLLSPESAQVMPGDYVVFRLQLINTGDAPAYNAEFRDIVPDGMGYVQTVQSILNGENQSIEFLTRPTDPTIVWKLNDDLVILPGNSLLIDFQVQIDPLLSSARQMDNHAVIDQYHSKASNDLIHRRQYQPEELAYPVSVYVPGLILSTDNIQTSLPGTPVMFVHRLKTYTGNSSGNLSFSIDSQQNLSWVIYMDSNHNNQLDKDDAIWINNDEITSTDQDLYLRTVVPQNLPPGWQERTVLRATLTVGEQTFVREVIDITKISDIKSSEMLGIKTVAVDSDCDTYLTDEPIANQTFEKAKSIAQGECAIYKIEFINKGDGKLLKIVVSDDIPNYSKYLGGSAMVDSLPEGLSIGEIIAPADLGTGQIVWPFYGELLPGMSGAVRYEVLVDD